MTTGLLGVVESAISVLNKERNVHFKALPQTEGAFQSDVALETETITLIVDCRNGDGGQKRIPGMPRRAFRRLQRN